MKNESRTESPNEIVEQISRLLSEAEALMAGATEQGGKFEELRARFDRLQSRAADAYGVARERVVAGARATDETVRSHPYESLAVALGAGVLLGAFIRRGAH